MGTDDNPGVDTLLIGLDAATPSTLDRLFEEGAMPATEQLFETGVYGALESQIPPWTASAWPSLYTGTNPGKHGVYSFLQFDGYDWSLVDADSVREWSLWERLDEMGRSSVIVNVPVTHPPPAIDGAILPGYMAPESPRCHPHGLFADVERELGDYRIYPSTYSKTPDDVLRSELQELVRMRGEAFRYLTDRFDPDFGFLQFQQTDTVFHVFPGDDEAVRDVYGAVDEEIEATLDACDPDTVLVASDHGMGSYSSRLYVNEFLRKNGYATGKSGGEGMPDWSVIRDDQLRAGVDSTYRDTTTTERLLALAARFGITSQRIGRTLERVGLLDVAQRLVPADAVRAASEQIDFERSVAYMRTRPECGIRINLEGREPAGVVPEDDYEFVRDELVSLLSGLDGPDGRPVFEDVSPREQYFHGPHVDAAPDVITVPREFDTYLGTWLVGDEFEVPSTPTRDHVRTGVIAAAGAGIDHGASIDGAHLFDVAPTVLATFDVPPTDRMDGSPLPVVDALDPEPHTEYDRSIGEDTEDREQVEKRLAELGYIDR